MLELLSSNAKGPKDFWKPSKPFMLVFIGKLSPSTLRWVPMCQGFTHFSGLLHHFILAKLATSSIKVKPLCCRWLIWSIQNSVTKAKKWPKPWQIGTHLIELSESYPMNTNICILVLWKKVASALEGLKLIVPSPSFGSALRRTITLLATGNAGARQGEHRERAHEPETKIALLNGNESSRKTAMFIVEERGGPLDIH